MLPWLVSREASSVLPRTHAVGEFAGFLSSLLVLVGPGCSAPRPVLGMWEGVCHLCGGLQSHKTCSPRTLFAPQESVRAMAMDQGLPGQQQAPLTVVILKDWAKRLLYTKNRPQTLDKI